MRLFDKPELSVSGILLLGIGGKPQSEKEKFIYLTDILFTNIQTQLLAMTTLCQDIAKFILIIIDWAKPLNSELNSCLPSYCAQRLIMN